MISPIMLQKYKVSMSSFWKLSKLMHISLFRKNHYFAVVSVEYHNVDMEKESKGRLRGKTGNI